MSNMSHCRFQNTNMDLQDCIDYTDELINNDGNDGYGESLSRDEKNAFYDMIEKARYFAEQAEILADILDYNE